MYLIDETYFTGEYNIPNLNEMDSDTLSILNIDIDKYVRLLLQDTLGYTLFKDLDSYVIDGVLDSGAPQKWKDFVDGVEYVKDGKTYKWKGLLFTEGTYKGSLLVKYVYHYWLKDSVSLLTGTGEKNITATNAIGVNSTQRLVNIWNSFVNDYQGNICSYNYGNKYAYRTMSFNDWFSLQNNFVSLIQFLYHKDADYPDAPLPLYATTNQLGL